MSPILYSVLSFPKESQVFLTNLSPLVYYFFPGRVKYPVPKNSNYQFAPVLIAITPAEAAAAPPGAIDSWLLFTDAFASPFLGPHRTPPVGLPQPPLGPFMANSGLSLNLNNAYSVNSEMYAPIKYLRGGRGKSAVPARCSWPLTGPQVKSLGIHFCYCLRRLQKTFFCHPAALPSGGCLRVILWVKFSAEGRNC